MDRYTTCFKRIYSSVLFGLKPGKQKLKHRANHTDADIVCVPALLLCHVEPSLFIDCF